MFTTMQVRIYNGKAFGYTQSGEERKSFRGRLNFRIPESSEYGWIDGVCFRDGGKNGGTVGFLEKYFSAPEDKADGNGGRVAILTGFVRPAEKKMTVKVKGKKDGKVVEKEIPNVAYDTFEFVITNADFRMRHAGEEAEDAEFSLSDDDDVDFDSLEAADEDEDEETDEEEEDTPPVDPKAEAKRKKEEEKKRKADEAKKKKAAEDKKKKASAQKEKEEEEEDFFDDQESV